jgi:transposase-like protein
MSYFFARQTHTITEVQFDMRRADGTTVSEGTVCNANHLFRSICIRHNLENPCTLGGPGIIVEIDETVITRPKSYIGSQMGQANQWMLGGFERGSGRVFIVPVENRTKETLIPIIQKYIRPGSIIYSDGWSSYTCLPTLPEGYEHYTVNHSQNFIDPETGACTNSIEQEWQKLKSRHKKQYGTSRGALLGYIEQHIWRKKFAGPDAMYHLWSQIAEIFKCECD